MTSSQRSSVDLDPRRRRLLFRAWHRGTREMDLVLGPFADATVGGLNEDEIAAFEALIDASDSDIFAWVSGRLDVPVAYDTGLFARLKEFHAHPGPIHVDPS